MPKQQIGVNRSIVRRTAAVLASEEVYVPIIVKQGEEMAPTRAWTDFEKISVTYKPEDDVRLLAAELRGLLYHEGGHCRFTIAFLDLVEDVRAALGSVPMPEGVTNERNLHRAWNCLEDQRMETAVVSDAPRKAAFFTPMVMGMHLKTLDIMAANYPLLVWRKYLPQGWSSRPARMFVALHGAEGERFARDLDRIVTSYVMAHDVVTMWSAVCEYHVLLQAMRPLASNMDLAGHERQIKRDADEDFDGLSIPIDPSMLPPAMPDAEGWDEDFDPADYDLGDETLTEPEDFEHFLDILWTLLNGGDVFQVRYVLPQSDEDDSVEGEQGVGDLSEEDEDEDSLDGSDGSESESGDESGEGEASDDGGEDQGEQDADQGHGDATPSVDSPGQGEDEQEGADESDDDSDDVEGGDDSEHGGSSGSHKDQGDAAEESDPFTQGDLDELLQEAEEERYNSHDLDGDVEAYGEATDNNVSDLDTYIGGVSTNAELVTEAEVLARQIEDSFHAHTMDRAPAWVEQQRRGVLNVGRYMTRQPGDTEFFRQWTEDEQPGFDIAVTVMLDYSSSMSAYSERLAQAGYASKLACQKLDIPCTVVLWDTDARTLWDAKEWADCLPTIECTGGTKPDIALADLDNHRMERAKHLVLIMTDGSWGGGWRNDNRTLAYYKDAGRQIIGFGYGSDHLARTMEGYGCDVAFGIRDLMDIPHFLQQALLDLT